MGLDARHVVGIQFSVDVGGEQGGFLPGVKGPFPVHNSSSRPAASRSCSRAACSRDITVPMGTSMQIGDLTVFQALEMVEVENLAHLLGQFLDPVPDPLAQVVGHGLGQGIRPAVGLLDPFQRHFPLVPFFVPPLVLGGVADDPVEPGKEGFVEAELSAGTGGRG